MADAERDHLPRSFWWFLASGAVSWLGDGLIVVGFPLLAASLHASPVGIAAVVVSERLAPMLLSLPLGALADRWNTRRTAVGTNLAQAALFALAAALVAAGHLGLAALIAVAFVANALGTLFTCTTSALLVDVVRPEHFGPASKWLRGTNMFVAYVIGPGLGGLLYATGRSLPLLVDACSFVAAGALLATLRTAHQPPKPPRAKRRRLLDEALDGIRISFSPGPMRAMMTFLGVMTLAQAGSIAALVVLGTRVVGLSKTGFGWTLAAGNVAAVIMLLSVGPIMKRRTSSVVVAGTLLGAVGELLIGLAHGGPQIAVGLALEASAVLTVGVMLTTARLRLVPREQLGRMTGGFQTVVFASGTLGTMIGGVLAGISGRLPYLVCAGVYTLTALTMKWWIRELDAEPETGAAHTVPPQAGSEPEVAETTADAVVAVETVAAVEAVPIGEDGPVGETMPVAETVPAVEAAD